MCLFMRLLDQRPGACSQASEQRGKAEAQLLADSGIYGRPGQARQPGFEASSWARRFAKFFSEALRAVGPLGECL